MTDIIKIKGGEKMCCTELTNFNSTSRSFLTKEEKIEMLKGYREDLELEARGVAERIQELENGK